MTFGAPFLQKLMPRCPAWTWNAPLAGAMDEFAITTPIRIAHFLGQLAHESLELTHVSENLNYSATLLRTIFPTHFAEDEFSSFAYQGERIANRVYANRLGNGDEASGDGWHYRGRGPIQLTGKANYATAGAALGLDLVTAPEAVIAPVIGARVAGWFWASHGLNALADAGDLVGITKIINGGAIGFESRRIYTDKALALLAAA